MRALRIQRSFAWRGFSTNLFDGSREAFLQKNCEKVCTLVLNRPERKNALGHQLVREMFECLDHLQTDSNSASVVILKSSVQGVFCAGADLKERIDMSDEQVEEFVKQLRSLGSAIASIPVPTIAALQGTALGGGLELALACDLRIVSNSETAPKLRIGLPETALAIIPGAGGTQRLPRLIGAAKAKELVFLGKRLLAEEALYYGIVNEVAIDGYERALEIANVIGKNGPVALRMAKQAINEGIERELSEGLLLEEKCYRQVLHSKDRLEGLLAFKEKRSPNYKGE